MFMLPQSGDIIRCSFQTMLLTWVVSLLICTGCLSSTNVTTSAPSQTSSPVKITYLDKKTDHGVISPMRVNFYYRNLTQHGNELDLFRIRCSIRTVSQFSNKSLRVLQVSASNGRDSISYSLPDVTSNGTLIFESAQLLNPLLLSDFFNETDQQMLTVSIQSSFHEPISYDVGVTFLDRSQYNIEVDKSKPISLMNQKLSYVKPQGYRLNTKNSGILRIAINSTDDFCGTMILSNDGRSIYGTTGEINNEVSSLRTLTFTTKLDLYLRKDEVPDILYVYLLLQPDDHLCTPDGAKPRHLNHAKKYNITWSAQEDDLGYVAPISGFLFSFLVAPLLYIVCVSISVCHGKPREHERGPALPEPGYMPDGSRITSSDGERAPSSPPLIDFSPVGDGSSNIAGPATISVTDGAGFNPLTPSPDIIGESGEFLRGAESSITHSSDGHPLIGSFLPTSQLRQSWSDVQFVFYIIPALLQSNMSYQNWFTTGNTDDVCFHNYACARPLGNWMSFNHMVSNMGYVINSVLYLCFVYTRRNRGNSDLGTYCNYGIELCLGCAMMCEGVASALYHICPSASAYHFDTPFIQVMCVLVMLKLYANRHCTLSSRTSHLYISFILGADVAISIFDHHYLLRLVLIAVHLISVLFVLAKIAMAEEILSESSSIGHVSMRRCWFSLRHSGFAWIVMLVNALISAVYFYGVKYVQTNQIVTLLCILNMLMYFLYYFIQKWKAKELRSNSKLKVGLSIVSVGLWGMALYCFLSEETNWALTPAQSRAHNRDCVLWSFFDLHDLWHLFSAQAALSSLWLVSILDDDLWTRKRNELVIF